MISRSPRIAGTGRAALLLAALSCGAAVQAAQVSYQYYRFTPIKLRNDGTSNSVALSEFQFLLAGSPVSFTGATATNPNGSSAAAEVAAGLIDGNTATKWLDFNKSAVIFSFTAATPIDGYRFSTGNDATERDPVRWTLEGSADGTTWTLLDYLQSDFATPTARTTSTADILLPATVAPIVRDWTGAQSAVWDTTSTNWTYSGAAAAWDNTRLDLARFSSTAPATINLATAITARAVEFTGTEAHVIQGGPITFTGNSRLIGGGPIEVSAVITGTSGLNKVGAGAVKLSANNTFTGGLTVRGGSVTATGSNAYNGFTLVNSGGTLSFTGSATKPAAGFLTVGDSSGKGILSVDGTSTAVFNGLAAIGNGVSGAGAVRQSGGATTYGTSGNYLTLANAAGTYGSYELSGGTLTTVTDSGIRVGFAGTGVFTQTGGDLSSGRWFAVGGNKGVATFTGGTTSVNATYRLIAGDQASGVGVINIGTQAGGNAVVTGLRNATGANDGSVVISGGAGTTGFLNLNSGVLNLNGRIYRGGGTGTVNLNGGTIRAATNNVELMNNSLSAVLMFRGGVTMDTNGNDATFSGAITEAFDKGVYITGGVIAVPAGKGGAGYIGAPAVDVTSSGTGTGAKAIATVSNGIITGVTMTCPGEGHVAGDTLTFTFTGGGADTAAVPFTHVLTATEVAANNTGVFTKAGAGKLTVSGNLSFPGATSVAAGSLELNGFTDRTPITVEAGGTLTGLLTTNAPVTVKGAFAPGSNGVGTAAVTSSLTFAAGSTYAAQITDWTGAAGTGYDTTTASTAAITATSTGKFTVNVDGTSITNFTEAARQFTILTTSDSNPSGLTASNWQVTTSNFKGLGTWSLAVSGKSLVLSYAPGSATGYSTWAAGFPALTDTARTSDPDGDGIPNVLEYVLNGNPTAASSSILPQGAVSGSNYVFTFVRRAESKSDTTQAFEYGSTLTAWTSVPIPSATNTSVTITPNQPSAGLETVVVTVPTSAAVNGRLFGRLSVTTP